MGDHFEEKTMTSRPVIDDLSSFWMPFTANRQFKAAPRLLVAAKGMHYTSHDGRYLVAMRQQPGPRAPGLCVYWHEDGALCM